MGALPSNPQALSGVPRTHPTQTSPLLTPLPGRHCYPHPSSQSTATATSRSRSTGQTGRQRRQTRPRAHKVFRQVPARALGTPHLLFRLGAPQGLIFLCEASGQPFGEEFGQHSFHHLCRGGGSTRCHGHCLDSPASTGCGYRRGEAVLPAAKSRLQLQVPEGGCAPFSHKARGSLCVFKSGRGDMRAWCVRAQHLEITLRA